MTDDARTEAAARAIYVSVIGHDYKLALRECNALAKYALAAADAVSIPSHAHACSHHNCNLVNFKPGWWTCPIAALHDLADQFDQVYQANYAPAPTAENGVYHHARRVLATYGPYEVRELDQAEATFPADVEPQPTDGPEYHADHAD